MGRRYVLHPICRHTLYVQMYNMSHCSLLHTIHPITSTFTWTKRTTWYLWQIVITTHSIWGRSSWLPTLKYHKWKGDKSGACSSSDSDEHKVLSGVWMEFLIADFVNVTVVNNKQHWSLLVNYHTFNCTVYLHWLQRSELDWRKS